MQGRQQMQVKEQMNQLLKKVVNGDLAQLSQDERLTYYNSVCESVGLNPLTKPFDYITLNGKLTLYARKDATDQLRSIHSISIKILSREVQGNIVTVTVQATNSKGRFDESIGAACTTYVGKDGKEYEHRGDAKANVFMKAETKAKRRVTLSLVGLGILDESELEDIPDDQKGQQEDSSKGSSKKQQSKQKTQAQSTEPKKIEFCIKQKAEKENKGRKFYQLAILEESSGELKTVFVLKPADIEVINNGLQNGNLRYSGILNTVRENLCLEQLQVLEDSTEQKAS